LTVQASQAVPSAPWAAFDQVAARYDATFGPDANALMAYMRGRSLEALLAAFRPGSLLLEIGCGTGDEAIALAREGRSILAIDPSAGMLAEARRKIAEQGLETRIATRLLAADDLSPLREERGLAAADGAYAAFGPLNCLADPASVARQLHDLLRPGARLVCSAMNRFCLWETLWYGVHADPGHAFRRWRRAVHHVEVVPGSGRAAIVRYLTPGSLAAALAPWFQVERAEALPLLLPPPFLDPLYRRHPRLFAPLARAEHAVAGLPLVRAGGDHVLLVARRSAAV
jgi:SAM-dependent methyltransferase